MIFETSVTSELVKILCSNLHRERSFFSNGEVVAAKTVAMSSLIFLSDRLHSYDLLQCSN